jgi:phenylalanyl-tRNA synthetase beta chain
MKASTNWLKEFVDFAHSPSEIAESLTMAGLEVEGIEEREGDVVLEINVTPNRPDCLSIVGIARELSVILSTEMKLTEIPSFKTHGRGPEVSINDSNCSRYSSRIIKGVKVKESPQWMQKRLEAHGIRPINNIVDITNYVLLEMGHPLHAFDLECLSGEKIIVKNAGDEDTFITLDGTERKLQKDMLLIWDAEKPVAIAGVMGGKNSEVKETTSNLLLESAYFNPVSVRRTSKWLNLVSESSYRFERGADIDNVVNALDRATGLMLEHAGGIATSLTDVYIKKAEPCKIFLSLNRIKDFLGFDISGERMTEILTQLGFICSADSDKKDTFTITVPSFRQDVQMDVDVMEEVARIYGYNNIPSTLPVMRIEAPAFNRRWEKVKRIKEIMVRSGFCEAINYSFMNISDLDRLGLEADDIRRKVINIRNPLRKDESAMRTTLLPALIENTRLNLSKGERSFGLFELSSVFLKTENKLPLEPLRLAGVYIREKKKRLWSDDHDGFYDIKGVVESLLQELRIQNYEFNTEPSMLEPYLHPVRSCALVINKQKAGVFGTLHPETAWNFDIEGAIHLFEIDVEILLSCITDKVVYHPVPRCPYIERDIAIVVDDRKTVAEAEEIIAGVNSDIIESVKIFDIYRGKQIPPGKKSLAFSIRYRANDRTLTDNEVNTIHEQITKRLIENLGADLRS